MKNNAASGVDVKRLKEKEEWNPTRRRFNKNTRRRSESSHFQFDFDDVLSEMKMMDHTLQKNKDSDTLRTNLEHTRREQEIG